MTRIWREKMIAAVHPLQKGVTGLKVKGYQPAGVTNYRPSRTAAVLVPILDTETPSVVLTRRADHLQHHPGQVSFPGGSAEQNDPTGVFTALREAEEEIGLCPQQSKPLGFLDRFDTISDFRILPVVALVQEPGQWQFDPNEVAEIFTVPLARILDRSAYQSRQVRYEGVSHTIYSLDWEGRNIWGATAAILMNMLERAEKVSAS